MTVFLTPDGDPFYGGTYFPKPQLPAADGGDRRRLAQPPRRARRRTPTRCVEAIARTARLRPADDVPGAPTPSTRALQPLAASVRRRVGRVRRGAEVPVDDEPRPRAARVPALGRRGAARRSSPRRSTRWRRAACTTTSAAASPATPSTASGSCRTSRRCSTTRRCSSACTPTPRVALGEPRWRQVVAETVEYVLRDLRQPDGGFSRPRTPTRPTPDGHGHEGLFHTWTADEVRAVLGDATPTPPSSWYGITAERQLRGPLDPQPARTHRGELARPPAIEAARQRLFEAREQRPRPGLDDKVLTEWNALMLSALAEAGGAARPAGLDRRRRSPTASSCCRELRRPDGRWHRSWHADGEPPARHDALAADHAASSTPSPGSPRRPARRAGSTRRATVADTMLDHFWDVDHGGLFTTPDDGEALVARQKDLFDNATPSANSIAAVALTRLAALTGEPRYANHADRILQLLGAVDRPGAGGVLPRPARRSRSASTGHHRGRRRRRPPRPRRRRHTSGGGPTSCWPGASRTTHRCGRARATAWPTCAATTPARRRRTRRTGSARQLTGHRAARPVLASRRGG